MGSFSFFSSPISENAAGRPTTLNCEENFPSDTTHYYYAAISTVSKCKIIKVIHRHSQVIHFVSPDESSFDGDRASFELCLVGLTFGAGLPSQELPITDIDYYSQITNRA